MKPTNQGAACTLENSIFGGDGSRMVAENGEKAENAQEHIYENQ
jgi:hypothetical protein